MIKKFVEIKLYPWEQLLFQENLDIDLKIGDQVLVRTELGTESGSVIGFTEMEEDKIERKELKILRKLTLEDIKKIEMAEKQKLEVAETCRNIVKKYNLPMKIVDCYFSFDGGRIVFSFVADGRIDFRNLVKDLTRKFQKSIRLQQIGMRDEAKKVGGVGPCGREVCCKGFLKNLGNITTDLSRDQQIAHRGSDRISGVCGRLMCCLAYEEEMYQELAKNLPPLESEIKTQRGRGRVIKWHILKQTVDVQFDGETILEIPVQEISKKH
jgi:cell fate regulator YaaT (PSP1 superfamily)